MWTHQPQRIKRVIYVIDQEYKNRSGTTAITVFFRERRFFYFKNEVVYNNLIYCERRDLNNYLITNMATENKVETLATGIRHRFTGFAPSMLDGSHSKTNENRRVLGANSWNNGCRSRNSTKVGYH